MHFIPLLYEVLIDAYPLLRQRMRWVSARYAQSSMHISDGKADVGIIQTLQTIAFSAYLRQTGHSKPFLVVCPLSVLHNWIEEYEKFAPEVRSDTFSFVVGFASAPSTHTSILNIFASWEQASLT